MGCCTIEEWIFRRHVRRALERINMRLGDLLQDGEAQQEVLMALQESFDALKAEVADTNAKIDVAVALIQALKDQVGQGSPITAEQLDAVTAELSADSDKLPQS